MQLISLNTWGGQLFEPLREFLVRHATETDIFCLQEIFHNARHPRQELGPVRPELFTDVERILDGHIGFYAPSQVDDDGLAIFVKKGLPVTREGDVFVHRYLNAMENNDGRTIGRNLQFVEFDMEGETYTIINFHGMWTGGGKGDTPERIEQSRKLRTFMDAAPGRRILVGDFNLEPQTESIGILRDGMRDLISEYGITSTRSHHYTKPVKLADYAIVSPDVHIEDFRVLQDSVSDHLPLLLTLS